VRLSSTELATVRQILEKIDRGETLPEIPGRVGRFFRQYRQAQGRIDQLCEQHKLERRADGAISGQGLDPIEVHSLLQPKVRVHGFPLGEVADTVAICEELGGLLSLVMWLKGPVANAAYNLVRSHHAIHLSGDYRWLPTARLTPGESLLTSSDRVVTWREARCLKAVADDVDRPPHALEYAYDDSFGRPGLKFFRCVAAFRQDGNWQIVPAFSAAAQLDVTSAVPGALLSVNAADVATLLIFREPWSPSWTVAGASPMDRNEAFAHAVSWSDYQYELLGSELSATVVSGIRENLGDRGFLVSEPTQPNLKRSLTPLGRTFQQWLRGMD
jgi:hypothetical protein